MIPFLLLLLLLLATAVHPSTSLPFPPPPPNLLLPSSDAVALLSFKSQADLNNKLLYTLNERFDYCQWQGVKCSQGRVVRFVLQSFSLRGSFPPDTLSRLDQLRVLSLHNNSLSGPIPDLSPLQNLKSLFLNRNSFSGFFPPSILALHRLTVLDLSFNDLSGPIPDNLSGLDRLTSLQLQSNRFNGSLPGLNQSFLLIFNVSFNNLTGPVPPSLSRFDASSFQLNPGLCGETVNRACRLHAPFFESRNASSTSPASEPLGESTAQSQGVVLSPPSPKNHKKTGVILGVAIGVSLLVAAVLCLSAVARNHNKTITYTDTKPSPITSPANRIHSNPNNFRTIEAQIPERREAVQFSDKVKTIEQAAPPRAIPRSGNLIFCYGEAQLYSLEQLMRASAELLGRGSIGTTYKAVLDNQLIVTVKRLDAGKTAITSGEAFEEHMDVVGGLRHPYLVPVRAYFQAKGERLVIYDYQPNGSLFNLIHGSKSTRARPLHWTSCLKIAEDVAQGLAYIHQSSSLIHGNLKSSNVLLGGDFEACLTDYGLAFFADTCANEDPDSAGYKAPEIRKSSRRATSKSDVYAFGILLLELLTGKHPSQHPLLVPTDVPDWVRVMRDDDVGDDNQLGMLTEVACICSLTSPEQRPAMWQVLKMIQEIKESVMTDDNADVGFSK
ncbi:probable inactive receptor kinase At5g67200 [Malus sylvestris]|uniref:probable inactive receptor kinase At5g67200 n=1 Tax=Malus sylvestris TaxID=3752 RepID=UPI0021ACF5DF|nr:probable inactive receptor kinase At5g67200 [Malus sylvestris]